MHDGLIEIISFWSRNQVINLLSCGVVNIVPVDLPSALFFHHSIDWGSFEDLAIMTLAKLQ